MSDSDYRIPDDMAAEVIAEAARLHAEASKGYSFSDLKQVCSEVKIPPHIIRKAIKNIEEKRLREQTERRRLREYIKQQFKKGISAGIALLIPAIAVSSIFIFRSQFEPLVASLVSRFNPQQQSQEGSDQKSSINTSKSQEPEIIPEPEVILREDFRNKVAGKTKQEVIQAVGRPSSTTETSMLDYWTYKDTVKDPASGKVGSATVDFRDGVVSNVDFRAY